MVLADSSVWINYFNGKLTEQTDKLDELLGNELIVVGDLIMVEVLQGFRHDEHFNKANQLFQQLIYFTLTSKRFSLKAAQNFRFLRKKGITVRKTVDTMIATFCIEQEILLLHDDVDFSPFEQHLGLKTVKL